MRAAEEEREVGKAGVQEGKGLVGAGKGRAEEKGAGKGMGVEAATEAAVEETEVAAAMEVVGKARVARVGRGEEEALGEC